MKYQTKVILHRINLVIKHPKKIFNRFSLTKLKKTNLFDYIVDKQQTFVNQEKDATIVIPIYNAFDAVVNLFNSLQNNVSKGTKIVIINDCSTDKRISKFLDENKQLLNIQIINNVTNCGFVKSVNLGMRQVKTKYAIWLNSDTIIPKDFVNKLLAPFNKYKNVASTTPFTNLGVEYSFPVANKSNNIVDNIENLNSAFAHIKDFDESRNSYTTGVGFCMAINMNAWRDVGELDEVTFDKGYGEENDWCFRAVERGWSHKLACNLFVAHLGKQSFGATATQLSRLHRNFLEKRYPNIVLFETPRIFHKNNWLVYRQIATLFLIRNKLRESKHPDYRKYLSYKRRKICFPPYDINNSNAIKRVNKKDFKDILNLILS